jgi:hypothetical protein
MFKDLQVSADLMAAYQRTPTGRKYMENAAMGKGSVVVLQASVWPSNKKDGTLGGVVSTGGGGSVVLPQPIREEMEAYERFYREKFKGRKLDFDVRSFCFLVARGRGKRLMLGRSMVWAQRHSKRDSTQA